MNLLVALSAALALTTGCGASGETSGGAGLSGSPTSEFAAGPVPGSEVAAAARSFTVTSPVMADGGTLPVEFTCDGAATTPPLAWSGAPAGTAGYAIVMHHVASPTDIHWYWVLYNVGPTVDHLDAGVAPAATVGSNSVNRKNEYTPPCSQGPGKKFYTFTVHALSQHPDFPKQSSVTRQALLDAIEGDVLGEATLSVTYERPGCSAAAGAPNRTSGSGGPPR